MFSLQERFQLAACPDLFRQQFFAERVQSDELSGQSSRVNEPFSHQHDFTDQFKVRNHHSTWSKKKKNIQTNITLTSDQNQNSSKGKYEKRMKSPQRNFDLDRLPEQSLEIFRQLSSAGVSRIHGDKETNSRYQHDLFSLEDEAFFLIFDGILDGFHLNCDHGQYLYWDTVELIKTAPGSCLCQSFVNVTNGLKSEKRVLRLQRCSTQQKNCIRIIIHTL